MLELLQASLIVLLAIFLFNSSVVVGDRGSNLEEEFKCSLPDIKIEDAEFNLTRFKADFQKISEVKFPSLIGPLNEKLICKIKCIDGNWVGPLCSTSPDGRFQPIFKECAYKQDQPLLHITFKNASISDVTNFPHGSVVVVRCRNFGEYKLKGETEIHCENGQWTPKFPACVPTTIVTNFTGDAPPTLRYVVLSGSAVVAPAGELQVFPDTTLRLACVTPRALGDPEWSWTQPLGQYTAAWSSEMLDQDTHFELTLHRMSARQSDRFTCTSPGGHTHTVAIQVVNVTCPEVDTKAPHVLHFSEGNRLGHSMHFSCETGYHLEGTAIITCMGNGEWSSRAPGCEPTVCPQLDVLVSHLTVVEHNSSVGGRAVFACAWGYRLLGAPGLECEADGRWSGNLPTCIPIYCPKPLIPDHGRILKESKTQEDKYPIGDLVFYSCEEGYQVVGEFSIVCTENGFWSHPPPFCVPPSEIRKMDTIIYENTTLVHSNE